MRDAERSCTPLDGFGGGILTFRWGKSHNGDFGLATNLTLFFLGHLYILSSVPQPSVFFLARNEYLGVKNSIRPLVAVAVAVVVVVVVVVAVAMVKALARVVAATTTAVATAAVVVAVGNNCDNGNNGSDVDSGGDNGGYGDGNCDSNGGSSGNGDSNCSGKATKTMAATTMAGREIQNSSK
jgi:hypothetical protein